MLITKEAAHRPAARVSGAVPLAEGITSVLRLSANPANLMAQLSSFETASKDPDHLKVLAGLKEGVAMVRRVRISEVDMLAVAIRGKGNSVCLIFDVHPQTLTDNEAFMRLMKLEDPFAIIGPGKLYVKRADKGEIAALMRQSADMAAFLTLRPPRPVSLAPSQDEIRSWREEAAAAGLLGAARMLGAMREQGPLMLELRRSVLIEALNRTSNAGLCLEHLPLETRLAARRMRSWKGMIGRLREPCDDHGTLPSVKKMAEELARPGMFQASARKLVAGLGYSASLRGPDPLIRDSCLLCRSRETGILALAEGSGTPFSAIVAAETALRLKEERDSLARSPESTIKERIGAIGGCRIREEGLGRLTVALRGKDGFSVYTYEQGKDGVEVSERPAPLALFSGGAARNFMALAESIDQCAAVSAEGAVQEVLLGRMAGDETADFSVIIGL